jgi:hypothetical protein
MSSMQAVPDTMAPLEKELQRERATSLGRAGAQLEHALAAWRKAAANGEAETKGDDRAELRKEAQKRLWYLIVQREALGLRRHRELYELYAIPKAWWY